MAGISIGQGRATRSRTHRGRREQAREERGGAWRTPPQARGLRGLPVTPRSWERGQGQILLGASGRAGPRHLDSRLAASKSLSEVQGGAACGLYSAAPGHSSRPQQGPSSLGPTPGARSRHPLFCLTVKVACRSPQLWPASLGDLPAPRRSSTCERAHTPASPTLTPCSSSPAPHRTVGSCCRPTLAR